MHRAHLSVPVASRQLNIAVGQYRFINTYDARVHMLTVQSKHAKTH